MSFLRLQAGPVMMLLWAAAIALGSDSTTVNVMFLALTAAGFALGLDESYRRRNGHHPST